MESLLSSRGVFTGLSTGVDVECTLENDLILSKQKGEWVLNRLVPVHHRVYLGPSRRNVPVKLNERTGVSLWNLTRTD